MTEIMQKLEFMRLSAKHAEQQRKRAVWDRIQSDMPEFAPVVAALGTRIGKIAVDRNDGEWVRWEAGR